MTMLEKQPQRPEQTDFDGGADDAGAFFLNDDLRGFGLPAGGFSAGVVPACRRNTETADKFNQNDGYNKDGNNNQGDSEYWRIVYCSPKSAMFAFINDKTDRCENGETDQLRPDVIDNSNHKHRNDKVPQHINTSNALLFILSLTGLFRQGFSRFSGVFLAVALLFMQPVISPAYAQSDNPADYTQPLNDPSSSTSGSTTAPAGVWSCMTCSALQSYVNETKGFASKLSTTLSGPIETLFLALAGLWVVLSGLRLGLHQAQYMDIVKEMVWVLLAALLLAAKGTALISTVYSASLSIMGGASAAIFSIAGGSSAGGSYTGLTALAANGEKAVWTVFQTAGAIMHAGGGFWHSALNIIYAVVLVFPYIILVIMFSTQVFIAIFRGMVIGVFAPFLFMAVAFGPTRDMAKSGAKILLSSILTMFAVTAALSLSIYSVSSITAANPNMSASDLDAFASFTNANFVVIVFLGWAGIALMGEATSIANAISGAGLSNMASAAMGAAMTMPILAPMKAAGKAAGKGAGRGVKKLAGGAAGAAGRGVGSLVDRFKNANKK